MGSDLSHCLFLNSLPDTVLALSRIMGTRGTRSCSLQAARITQHHVSLHWSQRPCTLTNFKTSSHMQGRSVHSPSDVLNKHHSGGLQHSPKASVATDINQNLRDTVYRHKLGESPGPVQHCVDGFNNSPFSWHFRNRPWPSFILI